MGGRAVALTLAAIALPLAAAAQPPAATAGWDKGFFVRSQDDRFELKIHGRVQTRFTYEKPEGGDYESAFSIPRARIALQGNAYTPSLKYKLQLDFGKGGAALKDFLVDYRIVDGLLYVRAGQWKRPFSRQQLTSSSRQEFVDRASTDKEFDAGRDIGIALHNNYEKSPELEWAVGIFNGTGEKGRFSGGVLVDPATGAGSVISGGFSNVPDRFDPELVGRLGYNYGGIKGYSEADLEGGALRFAVAGNAAMSFDANDTNDSRIRTGVDGIVKLHGASLSAALYMAWDQQKEHLKSSTLSRVGMHAQVGYVVAGMFQPVLRYAHIWPDGPDNDTQELLAGLTAYLFGHSVKLQADGGAQLIETSADQLKDWLVRTQVQVSF